MNDILVVISDFNQVDIATAHFHPYRGFNPPVAREAGIRMVSISNFVGVWRKRMASSLRVVKGLDALKHIRSLYLVILALAFLCLSSSVMAQDATIVGTVTDPSGAAVPSVKITLTNLETGLIHTAVTSDSGQYAIPELKIGHYDARAEASGFK